MKRNGNPPAGKSKPVFKNGGKERPSEQKDFSALESEALTRSALGLLAAAETAVSVVPWPPGSKGALCFYFAASVSYGVQSCRLLTVGQTKEKTLVTQIWELESCQ